MDFESQLEKPKRKLTDKQLKSLADGRKKAKIKKEKEIIKETKTRQRKERLYREGVLNEQKEIEIYNKLMEKGNKKIKNWKNIKYKYMEKATTIEEYTDLKDILDQITEEDILNGDYIDKLQEGQEHFRIRPPTPPLSPIEEEDEDFEENAHNPQYPQDPHHVRFVDEILAEGSAEVFRGGHSGHLGIQSDIREI